MGVDEKMTDWQRYTEAQLKEVTSFAKILQMLVSQLDIPLRLYKNGRPCASPRKIIICLMLKSYFGLSYRRLRGLLPMLSSYFGFSSVPQYNTLAKYMNDEGITFYLRQLVTLSARPINAVETGEYMIDSTGLSTTNQSPYYVLRMGRKIARKDFRKLNAISTRKYNVITSAEITDPWYADNKSFPTLLEKTMQDFNIRELSGDTAYCSKENVALLERMNIKPYLKPGKRYSEKKGKSKGWKKMIIKARKQEPDWTRGYGIRNNVESTFSSLKRKMGHNLKSRNYTAQTNEGLSMVITYNITQLIRASTEHYINYTSL